MANLHPEDLEPRGGRDARAPDADERFPGDSRTWPASASEAQETGAGAESDGADADAWSLTARLLFRFGLVYFALYALPFPCLNLWQLFGQTLGLFEVDRSGAGWEWMKPVNEFFFGLPTDPSSNGWWTDLWQGTTTWLGSLSWIDLEVVHQRTGSGDTAHDLLKLLASAAIALVVALLWSAIFRGPTHYRRLGRWLHLGARWYVAFAMLGYGLIKFYAGQFPYPHLARMLTPIGDTSPMGLVWTFMGFSKPYEVWAGIGETLAGLLLLSRRTSVLGSLVAIAVMGNVAMLNWFYDVPVKLYSTNLLLIPVALLVPDLGRLWRMFVANRPVPPANIALTRFRWLNALFVAFGFLWIAVHLYTSHVGNMQMLEQRRRELPELYGLWEVQKHMVNGEELAADDPSRWKLVAIDQRASGWARTVTDEAVYLHIEEDLENEALSVTPAAKRLVESTWTVERGTATVQVRDPAPRTMQDYQRTVDVERPSLVLWGPWEEADLELHLVRKAFELERGFHMVQELPYNR